MSELSEELDRLDFDYEGELVEITPNFDLSNLRFDKIHYNLIRDRPQLIPFWIAKVLYEQDIVEFTSEKSESFHRIKGLNQTQRTSPQLIELDDLTYRMFLKEMDNLKTFSKTTVNVFKLRSIEKNYKELLGMRTNKLLEMVRTDQKLNNPNLTSEEEWFFVRLNEIYTEWKETVGKNVDEDYPVKIQALTDMTVPYDIEMGEDPEDFKKLTIEIKDNEMKEIPLFVAKKLRDARLVTIISSDFIDKDELNQIAENERRDESMLTKIDPLFYHFLIEEINNLNKTKNSFNLSKLSKYQGSFNFIMRIRIRKILKHITNPNTVNIANIIPEEEVLKNKIQRVYYDWQYLMAGEERVEEPEHEEIQRDYYSEQGEDDTSSEWGNIDIDPEELAFLEQAEQARNSGNDNQGGY